MLTPMLKRWLKLRHFGMFLKIDHESSYVHFWTKVSMHDIFEDS